MTRNARWIKSSQSGAANESCVELALDPGRIRDSKNPDGAVLRFTRAEWEAFLDGVAQREFDAI